MYVNKNLWGVFNWHFPWGIWDLGNPGIETCWKISTYSIYLFVFLSNKTAKLSEQWKVNIITKASRQDLKSCGSWYVLKAASSKGRPHWLFHAVPFCLCGAPSNCVYFAEGHFTSGCLEMNGELISPTATSQSLHIYSPAVTSPRPGKQWHPCLLQMSRTESQAVKTGHVNTATKAQWNQIKSFNWVFLLGI